MRPHAIYGKPIFRSMLNSSFLKSKTMKYYYFLISILLFISSSLFAQKIDFQNQEIFVAGVNMPWNEFGWDFGEHHLWGNGYDSIYFERAFEELAESGVNTIRMWVHCDGRANPNFDKNGFVTGLDSEMLFELNDFLERANKYNLLVILTLWSHDMLEDRTDDAGEFAGLHQDLIIETDKLQSYLDFALTPIVQSLNHHCNLLAYEIISEPEWCFPTFGISATSQAVTIPKMQNFVAKCIQVIRANSNQQVTVGSAYACGNDYGENRNYWHESEFEALGFGCGEVYLDFYSFHYFEWMNEDEDVFSHDFDYWGLNKPILIAESATQTNDKNTLKTAKTQLEHALNNQYAGVLFWSYNARDEYSQWEDFKVEVDNFTFENEAIIAFEMDCDTNYQHQPQLICSFYPNPVQNILKLNYQVDSDIETVIRIYNVQGQLMKSKKASLESNNHSLEFPFLDFQQGVYILEIWQNRTNNYSKIFTQRIVKM
jgi:hypothetical protein